MDKIYAPLALKLHAFGLTCLHDPNWTGCILFDKLKQHVRGRVEPVDMLYKTIPNGLLYHLGVWILEDYFDSNYLLEQLKNEYRSWYIEDIVEALIQYDENAAEKESIKKAIELIEQINDLYDTSDDSKYFDFLDSEEGVERITDCFECISNDFSVIIPDMYDLYAKDYAERVFHDRQLCSFISGLLVNIGFDGMDSPDDSSPNKWVERKYWPRWAVKSVFSRDRGNCSHCGANLAIELKEDENIDHIVPLSKGGTNDLSNLQLLCKLCNQQKYNNKLPIKTSIPPYLKSLNKNKA